LLFLALLIPLLAVGWLGHRLADQEQDAAAMRTSRLLQDQLAVHASLLNRELNQRGQQLQQWLDQLPDRWPDALKQLQSAHFRQSTNDQLVFLLDADGQPRYPVAELPGISREQVLLGQIRQVWSAAPSEVAAPPKSAGISPPGEKSDRLELPQLSSRVLERPLGAEAKKESSVSREAEESTLDLRDAPSDPFPSNPTSSSPDGMPVSPRSVAVPAQQNFRKAPPSVIEENLAQQSGWDSIYLDKSLQLLRWRRLSDGGLIGMELHRADLLFDFIALLPADDQQLPDARIRLRNAQGEILYQWGGFSPADAQRPDASLALTAPINSWQLEYFLNPLSQPASSLRKLQLLVLLGGMLLFLALLGLFIHHELRRALREASQRVNFVNQVSHELKTPLTNIRLYAELLQGDLDEDPKARRRIDIIVNETGRLSRLIGNVLTFARDQRNKLQLRPQPMIPDEQIRQTLEPFEPSMQRLNIETRLDLNASEPITADPDAIRQILANLISNVEKYAAEGQSLEIRSHLKDNRLLIEISDAGPGIPARQRKRIFNPFVRLRSDLAEGVSGTGIGLSIARQLARLHDGDLRCLHQAKGSRFRLEIPVIQESTS
jgi:signal transduction histidine kinase